jgi:hypothetical protein
MGEPATPGIATHVSRHGGIVDTPFEPTPEPRGDLVPPPRKPPTAIAAAPAPERHPSRAEVYPTTAGRSPFLVAADIVLDALDVVGDRLHELIFRPAA